MYWYTPPKRTQNVAIIVNVNEIDVFLLIDISVIVITEKLC